MARSPFLHQLGICPIGRPPRAVQLCESNGELNRIRTLRGAGSGVCVWGGGEGG